MTKTNHNGAPVRQRIVVLDALRGFALLGIILANFPEFSLWTFQSENVQQAMDTAAADSTVKWLLSLLVDGKFYFNFSILFGIGFSIILENAAKRSANGMRIFYRRMAMLAFFGLFHLMFLWSGDILLLYAAMGADIGLWPTEVLAIVVFLFQIGFSALWLRFCQFGPLELLWRMLTYGRRFPLRRME